MNEKNMNEEGISGESTSIEKSELLLPENPKISEFKKSDKPKVNDVSKLNRNTIYTHSALLTAKYKFCRLAINRVINDNVVRRKKASIRAAKGVISPSLIVYAKDCLNAGLEVKDWEGHEITYDTPKLEYYIVIIDGQHRHQAITELNALIKDDNRYENYYYLPLINEGDIVAMLRESNVATQPWRGTDYLTALLMTREDANIPMLLFVKKRQEDSSETAAWLWATLDKSRVYKKTKINKAATDNKTFEEIAKDDDFKDGEALYEAMCKAFKTAFVGLKPCPLWVIGKLKELGKDMSQKDAVQNLKDFFDKVGRKEAEAIEELKSKDGETKDARITKALEEIYNRIM